MTQKEQDFTKTAVLVLVFGLVVILTAGAIAYVVSARYLQDAREPKEGENTLGEMYERGEYTTDLSGAGLIQVDITLELKPGVNKRELDKMRTPIDDLILSVLRSRSREEVRGDTGMDRLKRDILTQMEAVFGDKIRGIYFTKYIVQ